MEIRNFYETSYLLSQKYYMSEMTKDDVGKKVYHFDYDEDVINREIAKFRQDEAMQNYINGIVLLRRLSNTHHTRDIYFNSKNNNQEGEWK